MSSLEKLSRYLGIDFFHLPTGIFLSQESYIRELLVEFNMMESNPCKTPMDESLKLVPDMEVELCDEKLYQKLLGELLYATITCFDISMAVGVVSRYLSKPQVTHKKAVRRILRYLRGSLDFGLL